MGTDCKLIYQGRALTLNEERAVFPDGQQALLEIIRHPGGAGALALDDEGRVCLIRQYRYAAGGWLWEIPAGRLETGEAAQACAQRELAEEAGLQAQRWQPLATLLPSPGICDERIDLFLARELSPLPTAHEAGEYIEIHWLSLSEARAKVCAGEVVDAKTVIALQHACLCAGE
ncbi:MAG TPA: NUDIX hydrolase [Gammaproteobacteria bacterium]|nr:NUDIX hydrolase [Gammaproteobacteria bacterium]